jgi:chemotaxis protein CheZ
MPFRRKIFRIEETLPAGRRAAACSSLAPPGPKPDPSKSNSAARPGRIARHPTGTKAGIGKIGAGELRCLKDDTDAIHVALNRTKHEIAALHVTALGWPGPAQMTRQLDAVAESAERATQQILDAAEAIEEAANTLSASLKREQEHALALDIRDNVLRIFEACNFQDLSGQRLVKVLSTVRFIEERIAHMTAVWGGIDAFKDYTAAAVAERDRSARLHGPELAGDDGHATQADVDAMFRAAG